MRQRESSSRKKKSEEIIVYFGCSMLGGYAAVSREEIARLHKRIAELGYRLASDHQTQPGILEREAKLEPSLIHDRDYQWLLDSDVGVFEISNPSLGVGSEISDMIYAGKPVLMLFQHGLEDRVSSYLRGKAGSRYVSCPIECHAYSDLEDAGDRISAFIDAHCKKE
jgi:hypothetical protein